MGKMDKQIVCINTSALFGAGSPAQDYFQGFMPVDGSPFPARIDKHKHARRRGDVEEDPSVKQCVVYALIVHPASKTAYAYQRSADAANYSEKRLHGKWSWGVGGHIESVDEGKDPFITGLRRELNEEVGIEDACVMRLIGFINDDRDAVGRVHIGLVYAVVVDSPLLAPRDGEIAHGSFIPLSQFKEIAASKDCEVEGWSHILLQPLAQLLEGKRLTRASF